MIEATEDGYAAKPQQLRAKDYGCRLPDASHLQGSDSANVGGHAPEFRRQAILLETLAKLEEVSPTAYYHVLALRNLEQWAKDAAEKPAAGCVVHVLPGDWGEVTLQMTRRYGKMFASLNMANAFGPGGGYTHGMVAQEENMFRRTDCRASHATPTHATPTHAAPAPPRPRLPFTSLASLGRLLAATGAHGRWLVQG